MVKACWEMCGPSNVSVRQLKEKECSWEVEVKTERWDPEDRQDSESVPWSSPSIMYLFKSFSCQEFFFQCSLLMSLLPNLFMSDRQENELENICSDLFLLECELADGRMIGYFKLPMLWDFKHISGVYGWEAGWEQMLLLLCKKKSINSIPSLIQMLIQLG